MQGKTFETLLHVEASSDTHRVDTRIVVVMLFSRTRLFAIAGLNQQKPEQRHEPNNNSERQESLRI